ncbi:MAG: Crp/Fnr family transcriptional regulator [Bacteroidota bacterium]
MDKLNFLPHELKEAIKKHGQYMEIPPGTQLIKVGQYIRSVPIVLEGAIKVKSEFQEKELLLYYIKTKESCIMSLTALLENSPSRIEAISETACKFYLIPGNMVQEWMRKYPQFQGLFFQQFYQRYDDLLDNINQLLFNNLEERLFQYLREKVKVSQVNPLKISHRFIAEDLGTAREVISRTIKKLEHEGKVVQEGHGLIKVL